MQRFYQLQHLRSAQNSGIPRYLSLFYAREIEISISLPPDKRNLNRGICHTLIFDPPEMTYLQDFHQFKVKYPGQSGIQSRVFKDKKTQAKDQSMEGLVSNTIIRLKSFIISPMIDYTP